MGVTAPLGWTVVGHVPGELGECQAASHTYTFHANSTPEVRADDLIRKMWDEYICDGYLRSGPAFDTRRNACNPKSVGEKMLY